MATRLYLSNLAADVTPSFAAWQELGTSLRTRMLAATTSDALASTNINTTTPGNATLHRQLISEPLAAGITFTSGSATFTCQILGQESATNDNIINRVRVVKVISRDGGTIRSTLIALGNATSVVEWNNTGLRNLTFLNATAATATYTTVAGDRLCLEVGHNDSAGASITGTLRFGADNAGTGDLGINETDTTTTLRPWFESSVTLTFEAAVSDDGHDGDQVQRVWSGTARRLGMAALATTLLAAQVQLGVGLEDEIPTAAPAPAISEDYAVVQPVLEFVSRTAHTVDEVIVSAAAGPKTITPDPGGYTVTGATTVLTRSGGAPALSEDYWVVWSSTEARRRAPPDTIDEVITSAAAPKVLTPLPGAYTVTGAPVSLNRGRVVVPLPGTYSVTGATVTLRRGRSVVPIAGTYTITGTSVSLTRGRLVVPTSGAYAVTGTSPTLIDSHPAVGGSYALTGSLVTLTRTSSGGAAKSITPLPGTYAVTGSGIGFISVVSAPSGTYAVTGTSPTLIISHGAVGGTYAVTGSSVTLNKSGTQPPKSITPLPGTYTLTGQGIGFISIVVNPSGSYTVTGAMTTLTKGTGAPPPLSEDYWVVWSSTYAAPRPLPITTDEIIAAAAGPKILTPLPGAYAVSGATTTLTKSGPTAAALSEDYWVVWPAIQTVRRQVITTDDEFAPQVGQPDEAYLVILVETSWPQPARVWLGTESDEIGPAGAGPKTVTPLPGAYSVTGASVSLNRNRSVTPTAGAYTVTGATTTLRRPSRVLTVGSGTYTVTGAVTTVFKTTPGHYSILPLPGTYTVTGTGQTLLDRHRLVPGSGAYAVTGSSVALSRGRQVTPLPGAYATTGATVNLRRPVRMLAVGGGAYSVAGQNQALLDRHRLVPGASSYAVTGTPVSLSRGRSVQAAAGLYTLTGTVLSPTVTKRRLDAGGGSYMVNGQPVGMTYSANITVGVPAMFRAPTPQHGFSSPTPKRQGFSSRPQNRAPFRAPRR